MAHRRVSTDPFITLATKENLIFSTKVLRIDISEKLTSLECSKDHYPVDSTS